MSFYKITVRAIIALNFRVTWGMMACCLAEYAPLHGRGRSAMKTLNRLLIAYTAWLCRILGVAPAQIGKARDDRCVGFAPRPEGALGFYY